MEVEVKKVVKETRERPKYPTYESMLEASSGIVRDDIKCGVPSCYTMIKKGDVYYALSQGKVNTCLGCATLETRCWDFHPDQNRLRRVW